MLPKCQECQEFSCGFRGLQVKVQGLGSDCCDKFSRAPELIFAPESFIKYTLLWLKAKLRLCNFFTRWTNVSQLQSIVHPIACYYCTKSLPGLPSTFSGGTLKGCMVLVEFSFRESDKSKCALTSRAMEYAKDPELLCRSHMLTSKWLGRSKFSLPGGYAAPVTYHSFRLNPCTLLQVWPLGVPKLYQISSQDVSSFITK